MELGAPPTAHAGVSVGGMAHQPTACGDHDRSVLRAETVPQMRQRPVIGKHTSIVQFRSVWDHECFAKIMIRLEKEKVEMTPRGTLLAYGSIFTLYDVYGK